MCRALKCIGFSFAAFFCCICCFRIWFYVWISFNWHNERFFPLHLCVCGEMCVIVGADRIHRLSIRLHDRLWMITTQRHEHFSESVFLSLYVFGISIKMPLIFYRILSTLKRALMEGKQSNCAIALTKNSFSCAAHCMLSLLWNNDLKVDFLCSRVLMTAWVYQ